VQGSVEPTVAAAVEAVADRLAGGGGDRCAAARRANAASEVIRPRCDQERTSCAAASRPYARLVEEPRCERADQLLDLSRERLLFAGQLQNAPGDRAECEQRTAELWIGSPLGSVLPPATAATVPASAGAAERGEARVS